MIAKLDAAARQLDCAIRLVAEGGDTLPVHTLTMAAFGILNDLAKRDEHYERNFGACLTKIGWSHLTRTVTFLKHANRDPEASIPALDPHENDWRIGFCLILYRSLRHALTPMMGAFHQWMVIRHPDEFRLSLDPDKDFEALYRGSIAFLREEGGDTELAQLQFFIQLNCKGTISPNIGFARRFA